MFVEKMLIKYVFTIDAKTQTGALDISFSKALSDPRLIALHKILEEERLSCEPQVGQGGAGAAHRPLPRTMRFGGQPRRSFPVPQARR